jgi:branched-chain amino acid transport system ATP-binding protein
MVSLAINNLSVKFGGLTALSDINMSVEEGERRGIIGPNGAGKTTLFNVICGNIYPTTGDVFLFSKKISRVPVYQRVAYGLGRTYQKTNAFLNLSVMENISLAVGNKKLESKIFGLKQISTESASRDLLDRFNLLDRAERLLKNLSYGEQRVVEILLALALNPRVLLLDEPAAGLSGSEIAMIIDLVKQLPKDITVVIIEHDMDMIFDIAQKISVLHDGRLIADGTCAEIKGNERVREVYLAGRAE